jgi:hypothetical protein
MWKSRHETKSFRESSGFPYFFCMFTLGYLPERHEQNRPILWFRPWGSNRGSPQAFGNDKKDKKDLSVIEYDEGSKPGFGDRDLLLCQWKIHYLGHL